MSDMFDDTLKAAASSFMLLPGAETIIYRPRTGSARAISAVISRNDAEPLPGVAGGSRPRLELLVMNDAINGISSATIDTGGDSVDAALVVDETPKRLRITEVLDHDAGLMLLLAQ